MDQGELDQMVTAVREEQHRQIRSEHDQPGTDRIEYLVTGYAGPDFPPYRFVSTNEAQVRKLVTGEGFQRSVQDVRVSRRRVTITEWEPYLPD